MYNREFGELVIATDMARRKLLFERGTSYDGGSDDQLWSFKKTAAIANILGVAGSDLFRGSDIANILLILKQVRESNMNLTSIPATDDRRVDTVLDWHNYIDLKRANELDEEEAEVSHGGA